MLTWFYFVFLGRLLSGFPQGAHHIALTFLETLPPAPHPRLSDGASGHSRQLTQPFEAFPPHSEDFILVSEMGGSACKHLPGQSGAAVTPNS